MIPFEIDFLPVGDGERSGDAIAIRYLDGARYAIHVVDGGTQQSGEELCAHIRRNYGNPGFIDHVVLTHPDNDHSSGLRPILEQFQVGALWMNRPWLYAEQLVNSFADQRWTAEGLRKKLREAYPIMVELEQLAQAQNVPILEAFAGQRIGQFQVLSPTRTRYLQLVPQFSRTPDAAAPAPIAPPRSFLAEILIAAAEWVAESWGVETLEENVETSHSNESSIVQIADFGDAASGPTNVLLTADAGLIALSNAFLLAQGIGYTLPGLRFAQIPHHGSRHNVSPTLLNAWLGRPVPQGQQRNLSAYVSAAAKDTKHPRKKVTNAFIRRGASVYETKGNAKRFQIGMPDRPGWSAATAMDFAAQVEA